MTNEELKRLKKGEELQTKIARHRETINDCKLLSYCDAYHHSEITITGSSGNGSPSYIAKKIDLSDEEAKFIYEWLDTKRLKGLQDGLNKLQKQFDEL